MAPQSPITRRRLAQHRSGKSGLEIGAGHWPFPVPTTVQGITFVSRHSPDEERELFPEVSEDYDFGQVDVVADLDRDGLRFFGDNSQDFVIASHVLEHLAAPIAAIEEMYRVTRDGGFILIVLPDRHMTFDKDRVGTPLSHLLDEHAAGIRDVDDAHIREFLANAAGLLHPTDEELVFHRARSVHVHCWTDYEFDELLDALPNQLNMALSLVDAYETNAPGGTGIEFGYVLEVGKSQDRPISKIKRELLVTQLIQLDAALENCRSVNAALSLEAESSETKLRQAQAELDGVYRSRTWRAGEIPRRIRHRF